MNFNTFQFLKLNFNFVNDFFTPNLVTLKIFHKHFFFFFFNPVTNQGNEKKSKLKTEINT